MNNTSTAQITHWNSLKSDYSSLKLRLENQVKKLTHDVMVPFGKFAFMPAKQTNTNEVLVLLGDNWFDIESELEKLQIVDQFETCDRLAELTEEIPASECSELAKTASKKRRIAHSPIGQVGVTGTALDKYSQVSNAKPTTINDEEYQKLIERLDHLEAMEDESSEDDESDEDMDSKCEGFQDIKIKSKKVHFEKQMSEHKLTGEGMEFEPGKMLEPKTKSILRKATEQFPEVSEDSKNVPEDKCPIFTQVSNDAFTGEISERENAKHENKSQSDQTKPLSKFQQRRLNKLK